MKRLISVLTVMVLLAGGVTAVMAQAKTNFAGKWTLVPDPNAAAGGGRGRGGFGGLGQGRTTRRSP